MRALHRPEQKRRTGRQQLQRLRLRWHHPQKVLAKAPDRKVGSHDHQDLRGQGIFLNIFFVCSIL